MLDSTAWAEEQLAKVAIDDVVHRERMARDAGFWDNMIACYHPDSEVEISWFKGTGSEFAVASRKIAEAGTQSFHQMSPSVVTVRGNRALVDCGCEIHILTRLDDLEMIISSHARLLTRVERRDESWLLSGFRSLYLFDVLMPVRPSKMPELDEDELYAFRPSYRNLAYVMSRLGHALPNNLPGIDDPASVQALQTKEEAWLKAGKLA